MCVTCKAFLQQSLSNMWRTWNYFISIIFLKLNDLSFGTCIQHKQAVNSTLAYERPMKEMLNWNGPFFSVSWLLTATAGWQRTVGQRFLLKTGLCYLLRGHCWGRCDWCKSWNNEVKHFETLHTAERNWEAGWWILRASVSSLVVTESKNFDLDLNVQLNPPKENEYVIRHISAGRKTEIIHHTRLSGAQHLPMNPTSPPAHWFQKASTRAQHVLKTNSTTCTGGQTGTQGARLRDHLWQLFPVM